MRSILGRDQEGPDARPDVMDLAVARGNEERLVDVRTDAPAGERRFGHQVEARAHLVAVHGELGHAWWPG